MSSPDLDPALRPVPSAETEDTNPRWIPMTPELFREGSIGREVFPQTLIGRSRPETIFDRQIIHLNPTFALRSRFVRARESEETVATLRDLANINSSDFRNLPGVDKAQKLLERYLGDILVTPHGHFLANTYYWVSHEAYPVPADREKEQIDAVEMALSGVRLRGETAVRNLNIVRDLHGLDDGMAKTLDEVGEKYGITGENVRQIVNKIKTRFSSPGFRTHPYLGLPPSSLGAELGFVFRGEGSNEGIFGEALRGVSFSIDALTELFDRKMHDSTSGIFGTDLSQNPLSPQVRLEIVEKLKAQLEFIRTTQT